MSVKWGMKLRRDTITRAVGAYITTNEPAAALGGTGKEEEDGAAAALAAVAAEGDACAEELTTASILPAAWLGRGSCNSANAAVAL
jgi:hypothetical protein